MKLTVYHLTLSGDFGVDCYGPFVDKDDLDRAAAKLRKENDIPDDDSGSRDETVFIDIHEEVITLTGKHVPTDHLIDEILAYPWADGISITREEDGTYGGHITQTLDETDNMMVHNSQVYNLATYHDAIAELHYVAKEINEFGYIKLQYTR